MTYLPNGDLKDWFDSETAYDQWLGTQTGYTTQSSYPFDRASVLPSVEIVWQISPRFGLSVGAGYFRKAWAASSAIQYDFGDSLGRDDFRQTLNREVRIVPLTLTAVYSIPLGKIANINFLAGVNYHLVDFRFSDESTYSWPNAPGQTNYRDDSIATFKSLTGAAGIHFGVGAETPLFSWLSLTVDALYRMSEIRKLAGDVETREDISWAGHQESSAETLRNQTLWYGKSVWTSATYTQVVAGDAQPDWLEGVRPFRFGLSGFILRAGIKIKL